MPPWCILLGFFALKITSSTAETFDVLSEPLEKLLKIEKIPKGSISEQLFTSNNAGNLLPIDNLNEFIHPFKNCFNFITNFQGVNLLPLNSPIILWEPKLALVISEGSKYFVLIPKQMGSMVNQSNFSSACSSFLLSDRDVSPCLALKYEKFIMQSRPLKCQVNIALYPQEYMLVQPKVFRLHEEMARLLKFPIGFHHNLLKYHSRVRPSTQVLNVLITNSTDAIKQNREKFFVWIYSLAKHPLNGYIHLSVAEDLFLYVRTKHAKIYNSIVSVSVVTVNLNTAKVSKASVTLHKLPHGFLNLPIETVLSEVSSYYKNNLIYYQLLTSSETKGSNVLQWKSELMACNKNPYSFISRFWLDESNLYDNFDLGKVIQELVIAITPSIIRNATFIRSPEFKQTCKDIRTTIEHDKVFYSLIDLQITPFDEFKFANVPLQMNNPMQSFKFLSCVVFHAFEILHNQVVDAKSNIDTKFSFNLFLEPLLVLLEEGAAFTANNLELGSLRWMLASLLIAGTVLSNAYKYDNVYNVIAPKKFVHYEHISQLAHDKFTIYTMLNVKSIYNIATPWPLENVTHISSHQISGYSGLRKRYQSIHSEVFSLSQRFSSLNKSKRNEDNKILLANTQLHPLAGNVFESIGRQNKFYMLASESLLKAQRKLLFDAIKICNRTAIIVPELFAIGMAERLKKVSGFKYVFVGIETLFKNKIAFEFSGWIPNRIWGRVEALRTSGIWEWWSNVVTTGTGQLAYAGGSGESKLVVEKPTINGNTQVDLLPHEVVFSVNVIDYKFPSSETRDTLLDSGEFIPKNNVITGIKVFEDRIFLTVPRWREGVPSTLNYIELNEAGNTSSRSPLIPYPSWEFQEIGNCSSLQYVQSMEIDQFGRMWVVDVGRVNIFTNPDNSCPPKLLLIDLKTDKILKQYVFPNNVVSYTINFLNDIVVGCTEKDSCWAYITDAFDAKLVIYNLEENRSWFVTHETMLANPDSTFIPMTDGNFTTSTDIDGIALSPLDSNFDKVYYRPLSSYNLYSVDSSVLQESVNGITLNNSQVTTHWRISSQADGLAMDASGNIYYGILPNNSVVHFNSTADEIVDGVPEVLLVHDDVELQWTDTFGFDNKGYLYFTTNRMQKFAKDAYDFSQDNFRVVRAFVGGKSYMYSATDEVLPQLGWSAEQDL
ncbi:unnamed protein product [Orchesella dallaii]|uniref:Bee-milk protein n=1 Tax=Orchesella dallaii TaxID=48710 RepID=A0ABP1S7B0_9HEXA